MSPVLTQRVAGTPSGISRAVPNCQSLHSGSSVASAPRGPSTATGSTPAGIARTVELLVVPALSPSDTDSRVDGMDEAGAAGFAPPSPSAATVSAQAPLHLTLETPSASVPTFSPVGSARDQQLVGQQLQPTERMLPARFPFANGRNQATSRTTTTTVFAGIVKPVGPLAALQEGDGLLDSLGDVPYDGVPVTTFIPVMCAPPSPTHSSAPCSPASSAVLSSGACRSVASATYRMTSSSAVNSSYAGAYASNTTVAGAASASSGGSTATAGGGDGGCPLVKALLGPSDAFRQCFSEFASPPSIQPRSVVAALLPQLLPLPPPAAAAQHQAHLSPNLNRHAQNVDLLIRGGAAAAAAAATTTSGDDPAIDRAASARPSSTAAAAAPHAADNADVVMPGLSYFAAASLSGCSSRRSSLRDQNSVTIKATTVVKDAAGAIDKILSRGVTALVTALRSGEQPYNMPYDSLNQAVKAMAVARQYAKETGPEGAEVTFLPFHRYDSSERPDPCRFAFLVFPVPHLDEQLKTVDETVLNVARGSDVHRMASAIIAVMLDRGQAVMKAAGSEAIFVAMSAVVNARHRLIAKHGFDLMLAAAWITEDTMTTMGRESKFLRFNVLKTEPAGPKSQVAPSLPATILEA